MIGYVGKTLAAHHARGRSLFALTVAGVAIGVGSVLSIQIINRNALAAFSASVTAVSGEADVIVVGYGTPTLPESLLAPVLGVPGVAAAWPMVRVEAAIAGAPRRRLDIVGFDFYAPARLPVRPDGDGAAALTDPGWVAVTPAMADEMGWQVGDSVTLTPGTRRVHTVIGALVDFQRATPMASRRLAVMDIAQAQHLLGTRGHIHQIDVRANGSLPITELIRRLDRVVGPEARVTTPSSQRGEAAGLLEAFRLNLTALSLISIVVGVFLIYTSVQAALLRRRREFGVLRSLGATRGQVLAIILLEVTGLGILGVAIGIPLGYWAARLNVDVVSATLTNLYLLEGIERLELPPSLYLLAGVVGVGTALIGALGPAFDMSRRDPKGLLASVAVEERTSRAAPGLFAFGIALLAATLLWYAVSGHAWVHAGFLMAFVLVATLPLVTPLILRDLTVSVRVTRFDWRYAIKTLGTRLRDTSFAVAALSITVSMLIGITLMIGSFRRTLTGWIDATVRADIYVSAPSWRRDTPEAILSPSVIEVVGTRPGVHAVDRRRALDGYVGDRPVAVSGVDFALAVDRPRFAMIDSLANATLAVRRGAVFISEPLARKLQLRAGQHIEVRTQAGPSPLLIAGVFYDYSTERGAVVLDLAVMERHFGPGGVHGLAVYLRAGVPVEPVVDGLRASLDEIPVVVRSNQRLRAEALRVFDQTFAVTGILQGMSLLVAVSGITLTLLILARERAFELALYRALGATRGQVFALFVGKGVGMASAGLALGALGGGALAVILIFVTNRAYFGWTIQTHIPWSDLGVQATTIIVAALAACLYPAARATGVPADELSRDDR